MLGRFWGSSTGGNEMTLRIGIALLSMDKPVILKATLDRLDQVAPKGTPIVIVDNGSTDPKVREVSCAWEAHDDDWRRLFLNTENQGLSRGVNSGLVLLTLPDAWDDHEDYQPPDLLMHMDDDALLGLPDDWLAQMSAVFERSPELGLAVPMQTPESIPHPHGYGEIRWGLGFCWVIRRSLYELIGGYDPQLLHQQECDLAIRVRMAGYTVGAIPGLGITHNEPPGQKKSDLAMAREHLGVVQFRDKWTSYYRGTSWNYGVFPPYLMNHWPLDEEWFERFAASQGVVLNPYPKRREDGSAIWEDTNSFKMAGLLYFKRFFPVQDGAHWETMRDAHANDRLLAIARWKELTGEEYLGYNWGPRPPFLASMP